MNVCLGRGCFPVCAHEECLSTWSCLSLSCSITCHGDRGPGLVQVIRKCPVTWASFSPWDVVL